MARHEVPTVFVHGPAAPGDVRAVEEQLADALSSLVGVRYTVLWIDTTSTPAAVEIEAGTAQGPINVRATGPDVRELGTACVDALTQRFDAGRLAMTNGA
jgi:hypothetical protein